ncbi:cadherin-like domain-containing protein [Thalassomonas viridans]|uniref:Cadherin-like domain-containing protein n=1 Tax=Thalassomonas viridans TaxID=137584 RepID=A0AAE9Z2K4_9GAMM|nr:Ig-like domain-containing protein [Thalassomonas viridans]WDE04879.1 cadherin-like domain-containing protein [Thalassomonas viridans]
MQQHKNLIRKCALAIAMTFSSASMAADYSEFAVMPTASNDGLSFDAGGNLYVSHAGTFGNAGLSGTSVRKISPDGVISDAATGLSGPIGNRFDSAGNMYVANYNTGEITKVAPDGASSTFAQLGNASGIIINAQDELFVSSYNESVIYKISPDGESELWLTGEGLNGPVGIDLDEDGNLYVGNYNDGRVFKITGDKTITELAPAPDYIGHLAYANHMVYTTALSQDLIYQIPVTGGDAVQLEGSAEGGFSFPNGITASPDGSRLYVSNFENDRIILIENFVPAASDDMVTTQQDTPLVIDILANDLDHGVALDLASVNIITAPRNGRVTVDETSGSITYTPYTMFSGTDSLAYSVSNTNGASSNKARVDITITPVASQTNTNSSGSSGGSFGLSLLWLLFLLPGRKLFSSLKSR